MQSADFPHLLRRSSRTAGSRSRGFLVALTLALTSLADTPGALAAEAAAGAAPSARPGDFREVLKPTEVTRAVDRGVEHLRQTQLADGSWFSPELGKNTGVIGLATLAILSAGHVPGRGPYGEAVERSVRFLLSQPRYQGMLTTAEGHSHGPMYEHGIVALLFGEVLGMIDPERPGFEPLHRTHREAIQLILRAQRVPRVRNYHAVGGWRYSPTSDDADISVSGWQLLALRSAQTARLDVPKKSIDLAVAYMRRCQLPSGGFGYMPGSGYEPNAARTGTGVLALQICGEYQSDEARRGGDWLLKHPLEWRGPFFYYAAYYSAQATYQLGGTYWEIWRPQVRGLLLEHQQPNGSWTPPPDETHEHQAGPAYCTALAILSLTVDYKMLPIYQR